VNNGVKPSLGLKPAQALGYEAYLEGRVLGLATQAGRQELEQQWKRLRRGWYVGGESFVEQLEKCLEPALAGRRRESFSGAAKKKHDKAAAERALARGMEVLGISEEGLRQLPKGAAEKVALAWSVRQRTNVSLRWVSERLPMGDYSRVSQAVNRMRRRPGRKLARLGRKLRDALNGETQ
jgi:hypothetical protein